MTTSRRLVWLTCGVVFVLTLLLSVWHNDFPACYHPDEPSKVAQVLTGDRNFHHPPLMLDVAGSVLHLVSGDQEAMPDRAIRIGRWLSAFYMASACALFTGLAGLYGKTPAAVFTACLIAGNKQAVLAGHFFKEDPLFVFGLVLVFLAGAFRWQKRLNWFSLIILGAGAGFASATKYLGIVTLIYAAALELVNCRTPGITPRLGWRFLVLLLAALSVMFLLSVSSGWNHFSAMTRAIVEADRTAHVGNLGVGTRIPQAKYLGMFFLEPPLALIGFALCWWSFARNARPILQYADRWLLLCAPFVLLLVFSFSAITAVRYFLPVSLLLTCLGGCGLAVGVRILGDLVHRRWKLQPNVTTYAAVGVCALSQLPALASLERGFGIDDRRALQSYIAKELPANAIIAADQLACLEAAPILPQRIVTREIIADLGDLATLRAQGITHVVVCWYDSRRYVTPGKSAAVRTEAEFLRRREFYLGLKSHARLLWNSEITQPFSLRPGLSLYELSSPADTPPPSR